MRGTIGSTRVRATVLLQRPRFGGDTNLPSAMATRVAEGKASHRDAPPGASQAPGAGDTHQVQAQAGVRAWATRSSSSLTSGC
jgi:hypothetical protein